MGFPGDSVVKNQAANGKRSRFDPWVGRISWRRKWQLTPVFLPGKFHGQRSLAATVHGVAKEMIYLLNNIFSLRAHGLERLRDLFKVTKK